MADVARNTGEEFWRPPLPKSVQPERVLSSVCQHCGAEYITGARFCHVCGVTRSGLPGVRARGALQRFEDKVTRALLAAFEDVRKLRAASLVAFIAGVVCFMAAIFTGILFTAATVLDWQAVQLWRIEWLLAAVAAFLAGILLKKA